MNLRPLIAILGAALSWSAPLPATAQANDFVKAPIVKLVVPFAAGGSVDVAARAVGAILTERLQRPVVVENQMGASGQIAIQNVSRSPADGSTLLVVPSGPISIEPHLKKMPYDPPKDLTPVALLARVPAAIAVAANSPLKSVGDLVKAGQANAQGLNFAVGVAGGHMHLVGELIAGRTGMKIVNVPYRGNSVAAVAAAGGEVDFVISDLTSLLPLVKGNRLRLLAVTDTQRATSVPDIPTIEEAGFKNVTADAWIGVFGPAGLPAEYA